MRGDSKAAVASWSNRSHLLGSAAHFSVDAVDMISFDFEQNLPTPNLHHNDVFYARKLGTYNFGIHDCVAEKGYMYMWDETVAKRGKSKVAPCITSFGPTARVLDLWFPFLIDAVGKTKILLSLASTTTLILLGSMISLTTNSSQGATPSLATTLTLPKSRRGGQALQCMFQVIGARW